MVNTEGGHTIAFLITTTLSRKQQYAVPQVPYRILIEHRTQYLMFLSLMLHPATAILRLAKTSFGKIKLDFFLFCFTPRFTLMCIS